MQWNTLSPSMRKSQNRWYFVVCGWLNIQMFPQFLFMVYQEIFCRWLSRTGNQLDEKRPIFDIYRLVGEDGYMEIDICFPLE